MLKKERLRLRFCLERKGSDLLSSTGKRKFNRFFERKSDYLEEIIHFKKRQRPKDHNNSKKINK